MAHYLPYDETEGVANIVVDGAPNAGTVLTLSHWPGTPLPPGWTPPSDADTSAALCFAALDDPPQSPPAEVVTNNHLDQDGLVGLAALIDPAAAQANRALLLDLARAGDFATYQHRAAARASMAIWTMAHPERSPIADQLQCPYPEQAALLHQELLPLVVPLLTEADQYRDLWAEEDAALTASEHAIDQGRVQIEEDPALDLAVVTIDPATHLTGGHRFAADHHDLIHPMALHNATDCFRILIHHGPRHRYLDRYETWIRHRSRRPLRRVHLGPLAEQLGQLDATPETWSATPPSALVPTLGTDTSTLDPAVIEVTVQQHLRTAPEAWDPDS